MNQYFFNRMTNQLDPVMNPPYVPEKYAVTSVCIQPDPCPGCGNCLLCDSRCTCRVITTGKITELRLT